MKAQKSYDEMIQFLIADYSYYSICPDGSRLNDYLESHDSGNSDNSDSAA